MEGRRYHAPSAPAFSAPTFGLLESPSSCKVDPEEAELEALIFAANAREARTR